jgi:hypothetical protein
MKEYTVMLVKGTKSVARGESLKPDMTKYESFFQPVSPFLTIARLNDLADEGYMRRVWLPTNATPDEIRGAVLIAFGDAKFTELVEYGFRLLRVKAPLIRC